MKIKRILKFYFGAESINLHIDRLITRYACNPQADCIKTAEKISLMIGEKQKLNKLWAYIDTVAGGLTPDEVGALKAYSAMRTGLSKLDRQDERRIRSAGVKFARCARRLTYFESEIRLMTKYCTLL